jgi:hypothetical protein
VDDDFDPASADEAVLTEDRAAVVRGRAAGAGGPRAATAGAAGDEEFGGPDGQARPGRESVG